MADPHVISALGEKRVIVAGLITRVVAAQPFIDCGQIIGRRLVFAAREFRLNFQRNFRQLLLAVLRPGRKRSKTALT